MRQNISRGSSSRTSHNQDSNLAVKTGADAGATSDCPLAEDPGDVSVTNSEVESAMNHQRRRAIFKTLAFQKSRLTHSARPMHTSELLEMGLTGPQSNIQKMCR